MKNCLLLVDIQNDYFPEGKMELAGMNTAAQNARLLLEKFREKQDLIIHIQHISIRAGATFFLPGSKGVEINSLVSPASNEIIIKKNFPNSFRDTDLLEFLQEKNIDTLTICGAMSHMCIDSTTRAAFDLGFKCIVAEDACATRDLIFQGKTVRSSEVHAAFMAGLSVPYAEVKTTKEIIR